MESIGRYSAAIYRLSQSIFNHKLKEMDISSGQYDFFLAIVKNEGINQKQISELLYVEKSSTAKAIKHLESKGYIYKVQEEQDKRYCSLYLTKKGKAAAQEVESAFVATKAVFAKDIPNDVIAQTVLTLKKVISNLQEEKGKYAKE